MSEVDVACKSDVPPSAEPDTAPSAGLSPASAEQVQASACSCGAGQPPRFVYALGRIGYDLIGEARLDSLAQDMAAHLQEQPDRNLVFDPRRMLRYLRRNRFAASSLEWTLVMDGMPVYAIRPLGPFGGDSFRLLREFLRDQLDGKVDRVAVAGVLSGTATLLMGQTVPVIVPERRGLYSWTTKALLEAVLGPRPDQDAEQAARDAYDRHEAQMRDFLERIYHELRNLGVLPQHRAMNFAASNAFEIGGIFRTVLQENLQERMELDSIKASPSPISRPGSDCWDLEIYFFYPERQVQTVRKVYRYTVDVSDVVPVTVGSVRSWFTR